MSVAVEALERRLTSDRIRNVAIIAHVDHGKTTLVDGLLKQSGAFRENQQVQERVLDSNDQERERGITIFSKNASVTYGDYLINIVDTPGHADFGGQVERVLGSVDGALLIVDAFEGPMAQTRFVLKKALELGLRIIVVINKIDRPGCEPYKALDQVFDLFVELDASDWQLDFPHVFASARNGTSRREMDHPDTNLEPLFQLMVDEIPAPKVGDSPEPVMQITSLDYSEYTGRLAVGRLRQGTLRTNQTVTHIDENGEQRKVRIQRIMYPEGIKPKEIPEAIAGQIISVAGIPDFNIGDTLSGEDEPVALPRIQVDPATISMRFMVSDSPLCGTEGGKFLTSTHLIDRLEREAIADVALHVQKTDDTGSFQVSGRGVLHLSVLIEKMRREGYEFTVGRPKVITKHVDGVTLEPIETITVDVPEANSGPVIEEINKRKGEMLDMQLDGGNVRLQYDIPARGLIGLRTRLLTLSKGYAVLQQLFKGYERMRAAVPQRPTGVLISKERGQSVGYALWKLQDRGSMFIGPGVEVYPGMIVGEHSKEGDLVINVTKGKQLTNMRTHSADDAIVLTPPRLLSLEECLEFVNDDECVEVTPKSLRLRKIVLDEQQRHRLESRSA
ncbi:MAG TPA: translational GTPase TypA [Chloroflexota bacterium]|nr:translational GTPase TypA [Chloroflexota bacterium]